MVAALPVRASTSDGIPKPTADSSRPAAVAHLLDGLHQGVQQLLGALALAGVAEHAMADVEVGLDDPGKQLRAAEIDADHAPGGHARHPIRWMSTPSDPPPEYTKYRAGPGFLRREPKPGEPLIGDLGAGPAAPPRPPGGPSGRGPGPSEDDDRRVYGDRPRRRLPLHLPRRRRVGGPLSVGRVVKWLVLAAIGWVALSLVLFLISAQLQQGDLSGKVDLGGAGFPLTSPNTVLVLGSDARPKDSKEPGASTNGSRSDSILLMRIGGGKNARLSIPRDTIVDIPGHGPNKINAAYAFGGPALAVADDRAVPRHPGQPPDRGQLQQLPAADRRHGRDHLQGRLRRLQDQRRLQERRLHAAPEEGQDPYQRQAGARARAHPPQRVQPEGVRPHPRAPPAEDPVGDEVAADLAVRVPAAAADRLEHAQGAAQRHVRPDPARPLRRAGHQRLTAHADPQARRRADRTGRRRRPPRLRRREGSATSRAS